MFVNRMVCMRQTKTNNFIEKTMKVIKKASCIALFLCFTGIQYLIAAPITTYTLTGADITINDDGLITHCSYDFSITNIIIPSVIKGKTITGVADGPLGGVFENKGITALSLPVTFTKIGTRAFNSNSINNINISNLNALTQIGSNSFSGNPMMYFTLPTNSNINFTGWRDSEGNQLLPNTRTYALTRSFQAIIAYRLTDSDVQVGVNGELTACYYNFANTDIIIPDTLDGFAVKSIKNSILGPFSYKTITSVKLPQTIQRIGDYAFTGNNINAVYLNNLDQLEEIGRAAFSFSSIKKVNFEACTALKHIEPFAFENNNITSIDLSPCTVLQIIDTLAFRENSINTIDLSNCNQLTELRFNAFSHNSIANVDLLDCTNLLRIEGPFQYNTVNHYTLPTSARVGFEGWDDGVEIKQPGEMASANFDYIAIAPYILTNYDVFVVDGYIRSCYYNFSNKRIQIPEILDGDTIKGFHYLCEDFQNKGLKKVYFPSTLISISGFMFRFNEIEALDFSKCPTLRFINPYAFGDNNIQTIDFSGCSLLEIIDIGAFNNNSIDTLNLNDCGSLRLIKSSAFNNCNIHSINFSGCSSLKTIEYNAFENNLIDTLDFSGCNSLEKIREHAFHNCSIKSINFNTCTSLYLIGGHAFYNNQLSEVDFSECENLNEIGNSAFENNLLSGFTLPALNTKDFHKWVSSKGDTIDGNTYVSDLRLTYSASYLHFFTNNELDIDEHGTITGCNYNFECKKVSIPDTVNGICVRAIDTLVFSSKGLQKIYLPNTIEEFGFRCFYNNPSLNNIDIRKFKELKKIGTSAFASTANLLILPQNPDPNFFNWVADEEYGVFYEPGDTLENKQLSYKAIFTHTLTSADTEIDSNGKINSCSAEINDKIVIIPEQINGITVRAFRSYLFSDNKAYLFILPSTFQYIAWGTFNNSANTTFNLSNCIDLRFIGTRAFNTSKQRNLILPEITNEHFMGWRDGKGNHYNQLDFEIADTTYYVAIYDNTQTLSVRYENIEYIGIDNFTIDVINNIDSENEFCEFVVHNISIGDHTYRASRHGYLPIEGTININSPYTFLSIPLEKGIIEGTTTIIHDGTPQYTETLSVDTSQISSNIQQNLIRIQWYAIDESAGTTTAKNSTNTITLGTNDIGKKIYYTTSSNYSDNIIYSDTTQQIGKLNVDAPNTPTLANKTAYTITLNEIEGYEYAIEGEQWQKTGYFTSLIPGTSYHFVQRIAETTTHNASAISNTLVVSTNEGTGIPLNINIEDETLDSSSPECFGAVQNIVVAENGNQVLFQNGSNTNLIAGRSIRFLPGTIIEAGAYVNAKITPNGSFCDALPEAIVAANNATEKSVEFAAITTDGQFREATLKVFPNPSNGRFTIQTYGFGTQSNVVIYNSLGALVFNTQICGTKTLELYNLQKGIYIVKTTNNETTRAQRITIQ